MSNHEDQESFDPQYPREFFRAMVADDSPYAPYLFQWVPYQKNIHESKTGLRTFRLKMMHDIKLKKDRKVIEQCYPNGGSFHEFKTGNRYRDEDISHIRISKHVDYPEHVWTHPNDNPKKSQPIE